ncbi:MAG: hypothetical protein JWP57_4264 [Spirosoma sp.]|nr:hypothetical protein [Spirosoma sp.]
MVITQSTEASRILEQLAQMLDITPSQYRQAVERYQAVGRYLEQSDSPLAPFKPAIFPQGSFRYGTVIKPITDKDEFDVDTVCLLQLTRQQTTQPQLKKMVGDWLKKDSNYARMLAEEKRRCWRLDYAEATRFHLDILPAIPDRYQWLLDMEVSLEFAKNAICITDKETWSTDIDWPRSNPEGYALWFERQMQIILGQRRQLLAEQLQLEVKDVPLYEVKTPLQRSIQLLKRHRDFTLVDDEDKPISIIITTLAALSYREEPDVYTALQNILEKMTQYVLWKDGQWVICNPVNPLENFADRWKDSPQKATIFFNWVNQARMDVGNIIKRQGLFEVASAMKPVFGETMVNRAVSQFGDQYRQLREEGSLRMEKSTGILTTASGIKVSNHTFHGRS